MLWWNLQIIINNSDLLIKYKFEYHFDLTAFSYDSNQNIYDNFNVQN